MKKGFVYFLSAGNGLFKIGRSTRPPTVRIAEYSPLLPFETELAHTIECVDCHEAETEVHAVFEEQHVRGEWYRLKDGDIEEIKAGIMDYVGQVLTE